MIVIVDYGVGNLTSIQNMLKKAGFSSQISNRESDIINAGKLLLPGMGAFDNCMQKLNASGLRPHIEKKALVEKVPVMGICVGLQMFMRSSEEGTEPGLAWVAGDTIRFNSNKMEVPQKIPNIGWLDVQPAKPSAILANLEEPRFYFAHSYHVKTDSPDTVLLTASYGYQYTVAIEQENLIGVQFHPEKSHKFGLQLLKNFATL